MRGIHITRKKIEIFVESLESSGASSRSTLAVFGTTTSRTVRAAAVFGFVCESLKARTSQPWKFDHILHKSVGHQTANMHKHSNSFIVYMTYDSSHTTSCEFGKNTKRSIGESILGTIACLSMHHCVWRSATKYAYIQPTSDFSIPLLNKIFEMCTRTRWSLREQTSRITFPGKRQHITVD